MDTRHLVLAGDSIFDNDSYVMGSAGVIEQLRMAIPKAWSASKLALDGSCIADLKEQIARLPTNATDLIISIGGNDARYHSALLEKIKSPGDLDELINHPLAQFASDYRQMLDSVQAIGIRVFVCTIYTKIPFEDPILRGLAPVAIGRFNDVIAAEANATGIEVLKLHEICIDAADFSAVSPIEPSSLGGQKIVDHIIAAVRV